MVRYVAVKVHGTGEVADLRRYTDAEDTIETADTNLDNISFTASQGETSLDDSKSGMDNRQEWTWYAEDYLHNKGVLSDADVHVVLYNRLLDDDFSPNGGGFAPYRAGVEGSIAYGVGTRDYRLSAGFYGLCFVNTATAKYPYNELIYKNTVRHELGHTLGYAHTDGGIYDPGNYGYEASPMCTWYVETDTCGPEWGTSDKPSSLCYNANDTKDACYHRKPFCNPQKMEDHIFDNDIGSVGGR